MGLIYQRSPGMRAEIREYGCYFMSLIYQAAKRQADTKLFTVEVVHAIYDKCVADGYMREDCYVIDPAAILGVCGLDAEYVGKRQRDYACPDDCFEILHFYYEPNNWHHFVTGNGFGLVAEDPWGISKTATDGKCVSKRLFKLR